MNEVSLAAIGLPELRRPTRELAVEVAGRLLVQGERVDMRGIAHALGLARTTLYRWFGDREQLISEALVQFADTTWADAERRAPGQGLERLVAVAVGFIDATAGFAPLRVFVQQEPAAALRVLLDVDGLLMQWLLARARTTAFQVLTDTPATRTMVDDATFVGVAQTWPSVIIGKRPDLDRAHRTVTALLTEAAGLT